MSEYELTIAKIPSEEIGNLIEFFCEFEDEVNKHGPLDRGRLEDWIVANHSRLDNIIPVLIGYDSVVEKVCVAEGDVLTLRTESENGRPTVVCLCGSTRFSEAFREANLRETLAGKIVLSIGCVWHSDDALGLTENDKTMLDELHLRKIDMADEVLILNVDGYIGTSTANELAYARQQGKRIRFLECDRTAQPD